MKREHFIWIIVTILMLVILLVLGRSKKSFMEKTSPYISILLPTRKRPEQCIQSIESLYTKAHDKKSFEILLAFDNDDTESKEIILDYCKKNEIDHSFISIDRVGYENLEVYFNNLCKIAKGEMYWLWSDDVLMKTDNWDQYIKTYGNEYVLDFPNNHNPFMLPMVPSKYVKALGHFSGQAHCDTWIEIVFKRNLNISKVVDEVTLYHSRGSDNKMNIDYSEIKYTPEIFNSENFKKMRLEDTNKIIDVFFPERQHFEISD